MTTDFASPEMAGWQKAPQPFWYTDPNFPWAQLTGQFLNTSNGAPDHINNMDGLQAAYLFALPSVALIQDFTTLAGTNTKASHKFNARYEADKSYTLSVGVLGGGGGMSNGTTLEIALYFRDAASNMITVGATTITNSKALFPVNTHFTDFQVRLPPVKPSDVWAGKRIGIRIASTVGFDLPGGYWDIDNVRLTDSAVPNNSFESPVLDFAGPDMDSWQKAPPPFWYVDPSGMFPWQALMGQFLNTTNGSPDHIDNCDGNQGAYLFALPDVYIFQDNNAIGGTNTMPTHEFAAKFEANKSYALTVGVLGGGGGMSNGATFEISLYYRDATSNMVTVAARTITNSLGLFSTNTHLTDFQVAVPTVRASNAWAGKSIGIKLGSTTSFLLQGGYWDIDNVRLTESLLPNNSFELPQMDFAGPFIDSWEKSAQPFWYTDPNFPWFGLTGEFLNTSNGSPDHIDNVDGPQAAYLFALADVALFQDYISVGGFDVSPAHDFSLKYEKGNSYNLTVGVLGNGGGMSNGVTLVTSFYYRDAASNRVTIASTTITNTKSLFPTNTHLTDFQVQVPVVKGDDPWAGKYVGVELASGLTLADSSLFGGYWDVDNVRLQVIRDPVLQNHSVTTNNQFEFSLSSAPGRYEILSSTNVAAPVSSWTSLGILTNSTGTTPVTSTNTGNRFYQARPSP
ncbi:MAG: hypothetical protein JWM16_4425 [Verrucomicrobiales bacterium]|nr:hypothetical protein [Verrucomicrobiales bacterium]